MGATPNGTANYLNSRKVTRELPERSQRRMRASREDIPVETQGSMEAPGLEAAEWAKDTLTQLYIKIINEFGWEDVTSKTTYKETLKAKQTK